MVLKPLVWMWGRDTAPGPQPLQAVRVASLDCPSTGGVLCHPAWTHRVLHMGHLPASTTLDGSGWVLSPEGSGHPRSPRLHLPFSPVRSLQWNFIQAKAATALAQALQSNGSLASLE